MLGAVHVGGERAAGPGVVAPGRGGAGRGLLQQPPRGAEAARGLKLILRHNSLYAQATDAAATPLVSLASV